MTNKNGNAIIIYGGGLCPLANTGISVAATFVKNSGKHERVFVGLFSFLSLTNELLIKEWTQELKEQAEDSSGGFFGTCRNVDLTERDMQKRSIEVCQKNDIKWIYVAGGDGSARQVSEIAAAFHSHGINFIFFLPFTIDGIEGGWGAGVEPAVAVSLYCVNNLCATFLRTLEKNRFSSAVVILQGRNRDTILVDTLSALSKQKYIGDYPMEKVDIIALPANINICKDDLISRIKSIAAKEDNGILGKPVLYLISEGAPISKDEILELNAQNGVKGRAFEVGHLSQINSFVTAEDKDLLTKKLKEAFDLIFKNLDDKPFSVVFATKEAKPTIQRISYWAEKNPRTNQRQNFTAEENLILRTFMP